MIYAKHKEYPVRFCSLAQSCSHIGGMLLALNGKQRLEKGSCTSRLCTLVVPLLKKPPAKQISGLNLAKPVVEVEDKHKGTLEIDPCHSDNRHVNMEGSLSRLKELKKIFPRSGQFKYKFLIINLYLFIHF